MAENPLLPHRKLQELLALMERVRTLERRNNAGTPRIQREALLAATTIHLEPTDLISAPAADKTAPALAPLREGATSRPPSFATSLPRLSVAAATARGAQAASRGLVLALFETAAREPAWPEALSWAQTERLPLVFACTEDFSRPSRTPRAAADTVTPDALTRLCRKLSLPILAVDGEDAVAVFRVMQEAALRARSGLGPSLIHAAVNLRDPQVSSARPPLARLRQYMKARNIPLR